MLWEPRSRRDEEQDARRPLPNLDELPSEREFESLSSEHQRLAAADLSAGANRWTKTGSSAAIEAMAAALAEEFSEHAVVARRGDRTPSSPASTAARSAKSGNN